MRGLLIGGAGALLMGWFIYVLLASAGCTGPSCGDVSNLSALAFPVGLVLTLAGAFMGGGLWVLAPLFLSMGIASLSVGAFHGMPDMPAFPWLFGGGFVLGGLAPFLLAAVNRRVLAHKRAIAAELMRSGVKGIGTIVAVEDTGITVNENPRIVIHMRIDPDDGSAPVERRKKVTVSRVAIPRAGERFPAWFDRDDPEKWMYGTDVEETAPAEVKAMFARARAVGPAPSAGAEEGDGAGDPVAELERIGKLWRAGVLTDAEFAEAKARLLARIGR
jgi:hypothetical protein